jgi:TolA-binding protein
MKKSILVLALSVLFTVAIVTSCTSPSDKVLSAQNDVTDANKALDEAKQTLMDDVDKTKAEVAERIAANEKSIAEFNERIKNQKANVREEYSKKINELDQKNSDLKRKLDEYRADNKEDWTEFKTEFIRNLEQVTKALNDYNIINLK